MQQQMLVSILLRCRDKNTISIVCLSVQFSNFSIIHRLIVIPQLGGMRQSDQALLPCILEVWSYISLLHTCNEDGSNTHLVDLKDLQHHPAYEFFLICTWGLASVQQIVEPLSMDAVDG